MKDNKFLSEKLSKVSCKDELKITSFSLSFPSLKQYEILMILKLYENNAIPECGIKDAPSYISSSYCFKKLKLIICCVKYPDILICLKLMLKHYVGNLQITSLPNFILHHLVF